MAVFEPQPAPPGRRPALHHLLLVILIGVSVVALINNPKIPLLRQHRTQWKQNLLQTDDVRVLRQTLAEDLTSLAEKKDTVNEIHEAFAKAIGTCTANLFVLRIPRPSKHSLALPQHTQTALFSGRTTQTVQPQRCAQFFPPPPFY